MIAARDSGREAAKAAIVSAGLLLLVVAAGLTVKDEPLRRHGLQVVLVLMAVGEGLGGFIQVFRAPRMSAFTGRPHDPAYHGALQDFGFYNLAMAFLFVLCAANPERNIVLPVAILLYVVHGGTHLLRYFGLYYGGETPIPTRPRHFELRDAWPLLVAVAGLLLFYPSPGH